ncbi:MAG: AmmeMemoRadiSam system protein A [Parcubacteria group bacterium]|nr:AmmeMemoRadiSam system protein A [Parcubacteria group bacterium]
MTPKNKKYLLQLARKTIEKYSFNKSVLELDEDDLNKELLEKKATFVTLTKNNELRGCIGELEARKPLYQSIIDNSLASAFLDPRFPPVNYEELNNLQIEISILSPLKKLAPFNNTRELLQYLQEKKPGLLIKKDGLQATFLPQVWKELPEPQDFLSQLCLKAGLPPNQWQNLDLEISEYQVEEFKEE